MFQSDLLNRRSHFHLFLCRSLFLQRPVEPSPTDLSHLTHVLDTQAALHGHYATHEPFYRKQVQQLKRMLAEKSMEVDFFKGALQKIEARRQRSNGSGERASTTRSGMRFDREDAGQPPSTLLTVSTAHTPAAAPAGRVGQVGSRLSENRKGGC
jgi:hypothetical protein